MPDPRFAAAGAGRETVIVVVNNCPKVADYGRKVEQQLLIRAAAEDAQRPRSPAWSDGWVGGGDASCGAKGRPAGAPGSASLTSSGGPGPSSRAPLPPVAA